MEYYSGILWNNMSVTPEIGEPVLVQFAKWDGNTDIARATYERVAGGGYAFMENYVRNSTDSEITGAYIRTNVSEVFSWCYVNDALGKAAFRAQREFKKDGMQQCCKQCGSRKYLYNAKGKRNRFCGKCGMLICWENPEWLHGDAVMQKKEEE